MFERFTRSARQVVVLAQKEAAALRHNYIGTEHLLLGLLAEGEGIAAQALAGAGLSLADAREEVTKTIGLGKVAAKGHIPFTPRAKKTLELALREAVPYGYIGPEHLLLGILREGDGVAAQIMAARCGDLLTLRMSVLDLMPAPQPARRLRRLWGASSAFPQVPVTQAPSSLPPPQESRTTPAADASLDEAARLAGPGPVGSHHLLLAALADPDSAAARVLTGLGLDLERARQALGGADVAGTSDELPEERGRRHMLVRATSDRVVIEVTDQAIIDFGLAAVAELGAQAGPEGVISGDLPASASLARVWESLRDSLADIRRQAITQRAEDIAAGPGADSA